MGKLQLSCTLCTCSKPPHNKVVYGRKLLYLANQGKPEVNEYVYCIALTQARSLSVTLAGMYIMKCHEPV